MRAWLVRVIRAGALWVLGWVDACPTCRAAWREHRCPPVLVPTDRWCVGCGVPLPVDATKQHDGRWRCARCKDPQPSRDRAPTLDGFQRCWWCKAKLPPDAVRRHDGRWVCPRCRGVHAVN